MLFILFSILSFQRHTHTLSLSPSNPISLPSSTTPYPPFTHTQTHTHMQVENGDLNWCVDNKFIAFAGPHSKNEYNAHGCTTLRPEDYISYFKKKNVNLIVRLNKKYYESKSFTSVGIAHIDLYFLDGSNPPDDILVKFLKLCEETRYVRMYVCVLLLLLLCCFILFVVCCLFVCICRCVWER